MKAQKHRAVIPVSVPWTRKTWDNIDIQQVLESPVFTGFMDTWARSIGREQSQRLLFECVTHGTRGCRKERLPDVCPRAKSIASVVMGLNSDSYAVSFVMDALSCIQSGLMPHVSVLDRVEMGLAIIPLIEGALTESSVSLNKKVRRQLQAKIEKARLVTRLYAVNVVNTRLREQAKRRPKQGTVTQCRNSAEAVG